MREEYVSQQRENKIKNTHGETVGLVKSQRRETKKMEELKCQVVRKTI